MKRPKYYRQRAGKAFKSLGYEVAQDFRKTAVRLEFHNAQAAQLAHSLQCKLRVPVVIVRCFVNPVKKWDADDQFPAQPEDSRRLADRACRFREVLQNIGEQNGVEASVLKWQVTAEIDHDVEMNTGVKGICPIDADVILHEAAVNPEQRNVSAAHIQQPTPSMRANRSFIPFSSNIGNEAGADRHLPAVSQRPETTRGIDELRRLPTLGVLHTIPPIVSDRGFRCSKGFKRTGSTPCFGFAAKKHLQLTARLGCRAVSCVKITLCLSAVQMRGGQRTPTAPPQL